MMRLAPYIILFVLLIFSCRRPGDAPVPRIEAYPRVATIDTLYQPVDSLPIQLLVNTATTVSREDRVDGSIWLTVRYPVYRVNMYCTLTPVTEADVQSVVDNRAERIHLNLGGYVPTIEEIDSPEGYHANLVTTPSVSTTPIQFISAKVDNPRWVLSGTVFFDDAGAMTSIDSVAPVVQYLYRDVTRMLQSVK